jgi:hypothetical protein
VSRRARPSSSWQKERVELDGVGRFRQQEDPGIDPELDPLRYRGEITKFSGVLKCVYATRTCKGTIAVRGWFEAYVND